MSTFGLLASCAAGMDLAWLNLETNEFLGRQTEIGSDQDNADNAVRSKFQHYTLTSLQTDMNNSDLEIDSAVEY